jgi:hypothetical protein
LPLPTSAHDALHGLAWYAREALQLERLFGAVTVKRRRNTASPVTRRKSAFRDRKICMDFLAMAWLGATRLSQIKPYLEPRPELARAFGLRRFCDHTTAHNFLNACHKTHVAQLDRVNERLLREHGVALAARAPILDIGTAQRRVRHAGRRPDTLYRWGVAFSAGEAFTQLLDADGSDWPTLARRLFRLARERLDHKPALVRLPGTCASQRLFRAIRRERVDFLIRVSWSWARAHLSNSRADVDWQKVPGLGSVCDVSDGAHFRTVFVQQAPDAPGMDPPRFAMSRLCGKRRRRLSCPYPPLRRRSGPSSAIPAGRWATARCRRRARAATRRICSWPPSQRTSSSSSPASSAKAGIRAASATSCERSPQARPRAKKQRRVSQDISPSAEHPLGPGSQRVTDRQHERTRANIVRPERPRSPPRLGR